MASLGEFALSLARDMGNYTKWYPERHQHQVKDMTPLSLWDLHYGLYCAVVITLVRYLLVAPLFHWLAIRTMHLSPLSLAQQQSALQQQQQQQIETPHQRQTRSSKRHEQQLAIPPLVLPVLASFLDAQNASKARAKQSKRAEVIVQAKREADKKWNALEKDLLHQLNAPSSSSSSSSSTITPVATATSADVRRWLSLYQADVKRSGKIKKFTEAGWLFTFYSFIWLFGLITLSDKEYFYGDVTKVFENYPLQTPSTDVTWYYWLSIGHYVHLFISQFFDIKRKDFTEMLIHHVVTLLLLSFSWMVNFSRIGALVIVLHDGCDVFLQGAKLCNYMSMPTAANVMFVAFTLCFFICRLIIYPCRIIYTSMIWTIWTAGYEPWFVYYFFNGLLCSLLVLHIIWFSIIASMAWTFLTTGEIKKDARSDTDDSASDNESSSSKKQK